MKKYHIPIQPQTPLYRAGQLLIAAVAAALFCWGATHLFQYRCPTRWLVGIACPGCGMTRAAAALLRLDFAAAWQFNPFIYAMLVFAGIYSFGWVFSPKLFRSRRLGQVLCVSLACYWVVQFGCFLAGIYPAFFEPNAVLPRIVQFILRF